MAGGGIKPAELRRVRRSRYERRVNPVHVHDFQATLLHLLGIDHERLTFRFQGRDFRLTDVHGQVVSGLLAWNFLSASSLRTSLSRRHTPWELAGGELVRFDCELVAGRLSGDRA